MVTIENIKNDAAKDLGSNSYAELLDKLCSVYGVSSQAILFIDNLIESIAYKFGSETIKEIRESNFKK